MPIIDADTHIDETEAADEWMLRNRHVFGASQNEVHGVREVRGVRGVREVHEVQTGFARFTGSRGSGGSRESERLPRFGARVSRVTPI